MAQRASIGINQSIYWKYGETAMGNIGMTAWYDAKKIPFTWTLSFNRHPSHNDLDGWVHRPVKELHTDSTFGIRWLKISTKEFDLRPGFLWRKTVGSFDILAGLNGIFGITKATFWESVSLYETDRFSTYKAYNIAGSPLGFGAERIHSEMIEGTYMKYGFSPQLAIRHSPSKRVTLFLLAYYDWAKRVLSSEKPLYSSSHTFKAYEKLTHTNRFHVAWGAGFRF